MNALSDTEIYKNTYKELVDWVKELHWWYRYHKGLDTLNKAQAARIMKLEFDLRRYSTIMVEDIQEQIMADYGVPENNVIPIDEGVKIRAKRGGGNDGGKGNDWLSGLEWGTQIYVRMKVGQRDPWMLVKFLFAGIRQKTALLVPMMGAEDVISDDRQWVPVDPVKFCKTWELFDAFPPVPLKEEDE